MVRNALEASPAGDAVEIGVKEQSELQRVVVSVRDYGAGIPPEIRGAIFEPFRTTKQGGTGLGLSISHRIVEAHGGYFEVESSPGEGTTMRIVLEGSHVRS